MKEISFVGFSFENLGVMIEIEEGIFGKKVIPYPSLFIDLIDLWMEGPLIWMITKLRYLSVQF